MGKPEMPEKVLQRHARAVTDCIPVFLDIIHDPESDFYLQFEGHLREIWCQHP
jgi:hypothetical protein